MELNGDPMRAERYLRHLLQNVSHRDLGERLRAHRVSAGVSIRELATRAMVSKTSIVSLEQGKGCRPVTLEKICRALSLHVERLAKVEGDTKYLVHRQRDDFWFDLDGLVSGPIGRGQATEKEKSEWRAAGVHNLMLMFGNIPSSAGFIAGIVELNEPTDKRSHPGAEYGFVLEGVARIQVGEQIYEVKQGETFFVPDSANHSYNTHPESEVARILLFRLT